ncbi:hypothetical protein E0L93_01965 [Rubrobacter taiwanensis]|jgi:TM2 domain-containing membrane protein YozV|uniref:Uncharacterized protein n=1 Tax=Rubrobacter taiwanensis TaxID=185139 RepID=A0A4R1BRC5_9ACTN|nr:DUF5683 domain-containing protein [Rubrobacter taiwanensis]TCJ20294.1 hypothetical protein E0L93_01965 [Rubrobacter taiwanensis]
MKSAGLAAVLSFLIPGLGQIYNGQILKGLVVFIIGAINASLTSVLIGFVTYPVVVIYATYDAYRTASRINETYAGPGTPPRY